MTQMLVSFECCPTGAAPVTRAPASSWGGTFFLSERIGSREKGAVYSLVFFFFFALSLIKHLKCKCCFLFVLLARKESGFLCPSLAGY